MKEIHMVLIGLIGVGALLLFGQGEKADLNEKGEKVKKVKKNDLDAQKVENRSEDLSGQRQPNTGKNPSPPPVIQETGLPGTTH